MQRSSFVTFWLFLGAVVTSGLGCELIANVDRSQIGATTTGAGGSGGTSVTTGTGGQTTTTTTGTGGTGGTGGVGGMGGAGGGMPCTVPGQCPDPGNECVSATCDQGKCGTSPKPAGTLGATQTPGDCQKSQCDGAGKLVSVTDDADLPVDDVECTDDVCTDGVATNPDLGAGVACGQNGALFCDGMGQCVGCNVAGDCMGQDTECQTRTCTAGVCGVDNAPAGTALAAQTANDCKKDECDGNGAVTSANDNADLPVDGKACTDDVCTAGSPTNPPTLVGTSCNENAGILCDGAGTCAACLVATDCPGADSECQQRSCTAGVCGTVKTALGTAVMAQAAGDCMKVVCDGNGGTTPQNDDTDLPNDNNACTGDVCAAGVPSNPNLINGTACGGNLACLNGACAGCAQASDCPGVDDECKTRTCVAAVCGFNFAVNGTASANQNAGDCQKKQCDGAGNLVSVADNADAPVDDGNQCTGETCVAGAPSHPTLPANTVCAQNGGSFCSAGGSCVECNAAAQCPGSDTECHTRTCVANACGVNNAPNGTVTAAQSTGDCHKNQCDGAGNITNAIDDTDLPVDDGNTCTNEVCAAGVASHPAKAVDTACNQNGGSFCSAGGTCVQCNAAAQCAGSDTECHTRTCVANACGANDAPNGTATAAQSAGDCHKNQCDGAGNIVNAIDDTDLPVDDGNTCTSEVCNAGVGTHPAKAVDTACNQNGGSFCSAAGACVACNAAAQCPGSDTECHTRTCVANACGANDAPNGTATAAQSAGDCHTNQCDGAGNITNAIDDTDLPVDDGNTCTSEVCTVGVASHPAKAVDTACNQNGGSFCSAAGTCVACNAAAQCAGSDTECHTRTCVANACGVNNAPNGTATAAQLPNDCHTNQCDGAGNITNAVDDTDLPADDGNQCTSEVCTVGVPSHPSAPLNTTCNQMGGSTCDGAGACVQCANASQCPGADTECHTRTCTAGVCGFDNMAAGTVTSAQLPGDCHQNQCDGAGAIVNAVNDADLPADDGNTCTSEVCTVGVPSHPAKAVDTACNQNGGSFCSAAGTCVACNAAVQCPGSDTECQARTCTAGACGVNNTLAGTPTAAQLLGDCHTNQCDGAGNIVNGVDDADLPADDGNTCTSEVCTVGVPSHPAKAVDTACNQNGGSFCSAGGTCVACNVAAQCPGVDTECGTRTCTAGVCGANNIAAGTPTASQVAGDCKQNQCDGLGAIVNVDANADLPIDGNQCTSDVCTAGVPSNPAEPLNTACNQLGGTVCDGLGTCVAVPQVASTTPADGAANVAVDSTIEVTFTVAMNPATLTEQIAAGVCSGSIQVSSDNFETCIAFNAAAPVMSAGNTVATLTPALRLFAATTYKVRVTTTAASAANLPMAATFTQPTGFATLSGANACDGNLVISQVYGGGGNASAPFLNDFVELHNRGTGPVSLNGLSLQYTSSAGNTWNNLVVLNNATIQAGGFFLVQLASGGGVGVALPTPDQVGAINMSATNGKVALVKGVAQMANGICPDPNRVLDFVGYGTANCFEGTASMAALSATTAGIRGELGCADTNANNSNFTVVAPAPQNSASASSNCTCNAVANETDTAAEVDFCVLQFPSSFTTPPATTVFGRDFEAGTTPTGVDAPTNVIAQFGYGPNGSNPTSSTAWLWSSAAFNASFVDASNDEYQFTPGAIPAGTYSYTYRYSFDGLQWTYCDTDGAGSNAALDFNPALLGTMTAN